MMTMKTHTCENMKMSDKTKIKMLAKLRTMSVDRKTNNGKCESTMKIHEINNEV